MAITQVSHAKGIVLRPENLDNSAQNIRAALLKELPNAKGVKEWVGMSLGYSLFHLSYQPTLQHSHPIQGSGHDTLMN